MENDVVEYFGGTVNKDKETPLYELSMLNKKFVDSIMADGGWECREIYFNSLGRMEVYGGGDS